MFDIFTHSASRHIVVNLHIISGRSKQGSGLIHPHTVLVAYTYGDCVRKW